MAKLKLHDITICAADSVFVDFTARALTKSMEGVDFGDAILFSDTPRDGPFRFVSIPPLTSIEAYSAFCLQEMVKWIKTPRVLVVQWDGYVINPDAWANTFRKFDYIGAAWHGLFPENQMVGNGGFSLRSLRLLKALERLQLPTFPDPEDRVICHLLRPSLERGFGIRFAPVKIADRFAYEYLEPKAMPFGFHGVYHLWRHMDASEMTDLVTRLDLSKTVPDRLMRFTLNCARHGHKEAAVILYAHFNSRMSGDQVFKLLLTISSFQEAKTNFEFLERLAQS